MHVAQPLFSSFAGSDQRGGAWGNLPPQGTWLRMSLPPTSSSPEIDASELLRRIAGGDREAFSRLYDQHSRLLYALALRILQDPAEAEDVVHDVFVSLWTKCGEFDAARGTGISWVIALTRNRAIDRVRTRRRRGELNQSEEMLESETVHPSAGPDSREDVGQKETAAAVRGALQDLAPDQRSALELAFFSGLTQQEISARLQEPLGTVKARIRRGLLKLRDSLRSRL